MATCRNIRTLLPRAVEGELQPGQSLELAGHLSKCTACRILLARERRLSLMLDAFEDALPVDARFTDDVMAALPGDPPAAGQSRRGLRVVGLIGLTGLGLGLLSRGAIAFGGMDLLPRLPHLGFEGAAAMIEALAGLVKLVVLAAARVGGTATRVAPLIGDPPAAVPALTSLLLAACAALAAAALVTGRFVATGVRPGRRG